MIRLFPLAAALATSLTLVSAAAYAAPTNYYVATPAAQTSKTALMTRETPWNLRNGAFVAQRSGERDKVLCQQVARQVGQLSSFSVGGVAYDDAALADCNAHAKLVTTQTAAR